MLQVEVLQICTERVVRSPTTGLAPCFFSLSIIKAHRHVMVSLANSNGANSPTAFSTSPRDVF